MRPRQTIFAITALVWLLLSSVSLHAQPPVKKLFVKTSGQPAAVVVYASGADQTAEIQAAIDEAADEHLPLYMPDGVKYFISDTLTIPNVYGFEWYMTGGPRHEGSLSGALDGTAGALVWQGADDGRPMIKCYAAHCRFGMTIQGRSVDSDPVPDNLVGFQLDKPADVSTGKMMFDWLGCSDMEVGLQLGPEGLSTENNCDLVQVGWLELSNCEVGLEMNTSFSISNDIRFVRMEDTDRGFVVYGGGDLVVHHCVVISGAGELLYFPADSVERPVSRGSGQAIYRINNVKLDASVSAGYTLCDMAEADNLFITFDGGLVPTTINPTLLFNVAGETRLHVSRYRGLRTNNFRGNASGTRTQIVVDSCQIPDGSALLEEGASTSTTLTWKECSDNDGTNATIANDAEVDP